MTNTNYKVNDKNLPSSYALLGTALLLAGAITNSLFGMDNLIDIYLWLKLPITLITISLLIVCLVRVRLKVFLCLLFFLLWWMASFSPRFEVERIKISLFLLLMAAAPVVLLLGIASLLMDKEN